jgi:hypothetical protein
VIIRWNEGNTPMIEHLLDQQLDQCRGMFGWQVERADLSLRFGPDMPLRGGTG